ncbi:MAG: DNA-directed RNA polymerase subunit alpha C-terminal domain-containing protein [bacterium]
MKIKAKTVSRVEVTLETKDIVSFLKTKGIDVEDNLDAINLFSNKKKICFNFLVPTPLQNLPSDALSVTMFNALKSIGVNNIEDVCLFKKEQISGITGVGKKNLRDLQICLEERGLSFKTE